MKKVSIPSISNIPAIKEIFKRENIKKYANNARSAFQNLSSCIKAKVNYQLQKPASQIIKTAKAAEIPKPITSANMVIAANISRPSLENTSPNIAANKVGGFPIITSDNGAKLLHIETFDAEALIKQFTNPDNLKAIREFHEEQMNTEGISGFHFSQKAKEGMDAFFAELDKKFIKPQKKIIKAKDDNIYKKFYEAILKTSPHMQLDEHQNLPKQETTKYSLLRRKNLLSATGVIFHQMFAHMDKEENAVMIYTQTGPTTHYVPPKDTAAFLKKYANGQTAEKFLTSTSPIITQDARSKTAPKNALVFVGKQTIHQEPHGREGKEPFFSKDKRNVYIISAKPRATPKISFFSKISKIFN